MKTLVSSNEQLDGEYLGVSYSIKFHDSIQKVNINTRGVKPLAFAILGDLGRSENRKLIRHLVESLIEKENRNGNA